MGNPMRPQEVAEERVAARGIEVLHGFTQPGAEHRLSPAATSWGQRGDAGGAQLLRARGEHAADTELDTVVLVRDVSQHGLRAGDVGAVVEVYDDVMSVRAS